MRKIFSLMILMILACVTIVQAADLHYFDKDKLIQNNPDGKKFQFVNTYIKALKYLHKNEERSKITINEGSGIENLTYFRKQLAKDNVNLRIARNLLENYKTPDNPLILKVAHDFMEVCNQQVQINNDQGELLRIFTTIEEGQNGYVNREEFFSRFSVYEEMRKDTFRQLLQASMLISKVLISNKTDSYGDLYAYGITSQQKTRLLDSIGDFYQDIYSGDLRTGQTFIQASFAAIRNSLESNDMKFIDI